MLYRNKVINKTYIGEGVQEFTFTNNKKFYNSTEYIWSQDKTIKDKHRKIKTLKSGIDGKHFTPGEFLTSMKRVNINKKVDSFVKDEIPLTWDHLLVRSYLNEKDKYFKDSMEEFRYDKINTNAGTEVYYFDEDFDGVSLIRKKWELARKLAKEKVLNVKKLKKGKGKKLTLRHDQPQVMKEINETLDRKGHAIGEISMGYGKSVLFYCTGKDRKKIISIYVSNSIKNTAQLAQSHYFYALLDNKVLPYPMIVCSENRYTRSCVKNTGIKHFPVLRGENNELLNELDFVKNNNIATNIFVTYQSLEGLCSLLEELEITDIFLGEDEVDSRSGKPIAARENASIRYKHLFSESLKLSGTIQSRPDNNIEDRIYYNSDDFDTGKKYKDDKVFNSPIPCPDIVRSEKFCRENGYIADQRVLVLRFNSNNERFQQLVSSNNHVVLEDMNATMRADKMFALVALKKAMSLGRKRIHIPLATTATTKRLILAIKTAQKKGLLDPKYKVIQALIRDGDEALKDFNDTPFSIVIGTRWMNRGVDTVNLDTTIHTIEYSTYQSGIQTKGRGHRTSSEKDYHLNILCQLTGSIEDTIMYEIIQKNSTNNGYEIIGRDTVLEELDTNDDHIDLSESVERVREAIENNGIVIEQIDEEPVTITSTLHTLYSAIDEGVLVDENGNSSFRKIVGKSNVYFDSELYEEALRWNSFKDFRIKSRHFYTSINYRGDDFKEKCYSHMLDWNLKNNFNINLVKQFIQKHNLVGKRIIDLVNIKKIEPDFSGQGYYAAIKLFNERNPDKIIDLEKFGLIKTLFLPQIKDNVLPKHWKYVKGVINRYKKEKKTWQDLYQNDTKVYRFIDDFGNVEKDIKSFLGSKEYGGTTTKLKKMKEYSKIADELKDKNITSWRDICSYVDDMDIVGFMRKYKMLEGILERKIPNILQIEDDPSIKGTPGELQRKFNSKVSFLEWARKMEKDQDLVMKNGPLKGKRLIFSQKANY